MATPVRPAAGDAAPSVPDDPEGTAPTAPLPLNWSLAVATGTRLVAPGPAVSAERAGAEVARLHAGARIGEGHVRDLTGLGAGLLVPEAAVVDRPDWVRSAVAGIEALTSDVRLPARTTSSAGAVGSVVAGAMSTVTATTAGVQMGTLLAFLGSRVLGQYDPFGGPDGAGRLLLVAPNIVAAQQALDVDADDFALWVCLHEATHRLQFTAVPWLRGWFHEQVGAFASGLDPNTARTLERLPEILRSVRENRPSDPLALVELFQGPEQRAALDRLLAMTTLLEGHAEHVMDEVGPEVVPSVATIRERFTERRRGGGLIDRLVRTLLGMQAKIRQYEQGRVFVDTVVREVGMAGFNQVWTSPDTLPLRSEITDPAAWIARVHG